MWRIKVASTLIFRNFRLREKIRPYFIAELLGEKVSAENGGRTYSEGNKIVAFRDGNDPMILAIRTTETGMLEKAREFADEVVDEDGRGTE